MCASYSVLPYTIQVPRSEGMQDKESESTETWDLRLAFRDIMTIIVTYSNNEKKNKVNFSGRGMIFVAIFRNVEPNMQILLFVYM